MMNLGSSLKVFVVRYFHTLRKRKAPIRRKLRDFAHQKLLGKYLLVTNSVTSGVLMAVGDGIQQQLEKYKKEAKHDWKRTINMAIVGLAMGPIQHTFYKVIDIVLPSRGITSVTKKIVLDQLIASPAVIAIFFYGHGLLEDGNFKKAHSEMERKFVSIYFLDWLVWPPTQYVNFAYISSKYRVIYINIVTMVSNVFLSYIKHEKNDFHFTQLISFPAWRLTHNSRTLYLSTEPIEWDFAS